MEEKVNNNFKIKAIIVDDEQDALDAINQLLTDTGNVDVIEQISDSENVICSIEKHKPDVVFLDIDMPRKNGFEILESINKLNFSVNVVFATAFNEYILEALRNNAFDYLQKPIDRLELRKTLNRIRENRNSEKNDYSNLISELNQTGFIKVPVNFGFLFFKPQDIVYLEAESNYTYIYTAYHKELSSFNLGKFENKLHEHNFLKISRSIIINPKYLIKVNKKKKICTLQAEGVKFELAISRRKLNVFDDL